jgi:hypothetical protein
MAQLAENYQNHKKSSMAEGGCYRIVTERKGEETRISGRTFNAQHSTSNAQATPEHAWNERRRRLYFHGNYL